MNIMLKHGVFLLPALTVFGCIFNGGNGASSASSTLMVRPGFYRGDYGSLGAALGVESEMILDANGYFRFFGIHANEPYRIVRGTWKSSGGFMVWSPCFIGRAYEDDGMDFDAWDTVSADTSLLHAISDTSFERLEITQDTLGHSLTQWIRYRRAEAPDVPAYGKYEYTETYTDYFDTVPTAGRSFIELHPDGGYSDGRFANNIPVYEFESSRYMQAGSFLITKGSRSRFYDSSGGAFENWYTYDADYEYVLRIQHVETDSFQVWIAANATYQGHPYWAVYRLLQK